MIQSNILNKIYNKDDLILLLKNNYNFTYEEIDFILMMNYIYSNEVENINVNIFRHIL